MHEKFLKAQQEIASTKIIKDSQAQYGKYLSLHSLMAAVLPILHKNGLTLVQGVTNKDGQPALTTRISDGENGIESTMYLLLANPTPQGQGSGITYARRYALCSMLGIVADEDDDGQRAEKASSISSQQLKTISESLVAKGIAAKDQQAVLNAIYGQPVNVREITYLEGQKLLKDIADSDSETLKNLLEGKPF